MTIVGYPTADFPAPLPFSLDLPSGWLGSYVPGALLAAHAPSGAAVDGFLPNVVVTWQIAAVDTDVKMLARRALQTARERNDFVEPSVFDATQDAGVLEAALIAYGTRDSDSRTTLHAAMYVIGPMVGRARDLYHVIGTYLAGDDDMHAEMRRLILSFALATPTDITRDSR
jgi:hypothetical protein